MGSHSSALAPAPTHLLRIEPVHWYPAKQIPRPAETHLSVSQESPGRPVCSWQCAVVQKPTTVSFSSAASMQQQVPVTARGGRLAQVPVRCLLTAPVAQQPCFFVRTRHAHKSKCSSATVQTADKVSTVASSDVVALGNLCVDVVLPVPELPPADTAARRKLLETLQSQDNEHAWEVGGSCNFILAAARLGLRVSPVGHAGDDVYGAFMERVLKEESVQDMERILNHMMSDAALAARQPQGPSSGGHITADTNQTLVCYVMVDPESRHAFCSRYDFGPWPLLGGMSRLPSRALQALSATSAVFLNGFVFDELPLESVRHACHHAIQNGAAIFFDPGPRCFTMLTGERRQALDEVLSLSEVVLMTEEEAVTVTGHSDPETAARAILAWPGNRTRWCVVKMGGAGAVLVNKRTGVAHHVPGFKVQVADTVGCGDSFAAAIVLGYIRHCNEDVTLTLANAVGAATATGRGAGRNVASAQMVRQLLRDAMRSGSNDNAHRAQQALQLMQLASTPVDVVSQH